MFQSCAVCGELETKFENRYTWAMTQGKAGLCNLTVSYSVGSGSRDRPSGVDDTPCESQDIQPVNMTQPNFCRTSSEEHYSLRVSPTFLTRARDEASHCLARLSRCVSSLWLTVR